MQIAAYAYGIHKTFDNVFGANIYISTTEPGRMEVVPYDSKQLAKDFEVFKSMCKIWQYLNNYNPTET
jgi:hypothetical protein